MVPAGANKSLKHILNKIKIKIITSNYQNILEKRKLIKGKKTITDTMNILPFFENACTKSGSLRFSQFSGC